MEAHESDTWRALTRGHDDGLGGDLSDYDVRDLNLRATEFMR